MKMVSDLEAFHEKFGLSYTGKPRVLPLELAAFRIKFLEEELKEYKDAYNRAQAKLNQMALPFDDSEDWPNLASDLEDQLDSLVDLVYVAIGTADLQGFDFRTAWERVHNANMLKVRAVRATDSKRGTTFDVIKPPGWEAPSHYDRVKDHAHRGK